jgi:c-di-GMP-binding flagellar brake protein YcgR
MNEKRRSLRTEMQASLWMKRLDKKDNDRIPIEVIDLSKNGIGFLSERSLEIGTVYECDIVIWTKETIKTFVEVVRHDGEGSNRYGGRFVGMSENDAQRISVYQTVEELTQ